MNLKLQELAMGSWFALSLSLAIMMALVSWRAWHDQGYKEASTQAAISLGTFFLGSAVIGGWYWLQAYSILRGYGSIFKALEVLELVPIVGASVGVVGALCAVRVFFPILVKSYWLEQDFSWLIPMSMILLFLLITTSIGGAAP